VTPAWLPACCQPARSRLHKRLLLLGVTDVQGVGRACTRSRQSQGICWCLAAVCCYSLCRPVMVTVSLSLAAWLTAWTTTRLDLHAWPAEKGCGPRRSVGDLWLVVQLLAPAAALPLCTGVLLVHCLPNALQDCCLASRPGAVCSVWHCIVLCCGWCVWLVCWQRGHCSVTSSYQTCE
jgi:hypothetical protein